uniref:Uncharacterized protein n=1 Tax=Anguilla anguilla TaxID=7936 RepID=A0A0E9QAH7_ANGAN
MSRQATCEIDYKTVVCNK